MNEGEGDGWWVVSKPSERYQSGSFLLMILSLLVSVWGTIAAYGIASSMFARTWHEVRQGEYVSITEPNHVAGAMAGVPVGLVSFGSFIYFYHLWKKGAPLRQIDSGKVGWKFVSRSYTKLYEGLGGRRRIFLTKLQDELSPRGISNTLTGRNEDLVYRDFYLYAIVSPSTESGSLKCNFTIGITKKCIVSLVLLGPLGLALSILVFEKYKRLKDVIISSADFASSRLESYEPVFRVPTPTVTVPSTILYREPRKRVCVFETIVGIVIATLGFATILFTLIPICFEIFNSTVPDLILRKEFFKGASLLSLAVVYVSLFPLVIMTYLLSPHIIERSLDTTSSPTDLIINPLIEELSHHLGLNRPPKLLLSKKETPFILTCGRIASESKIVVSRGILNLSTSGFFNHDHLRAMLAHEICHILNRDVVFVTWGMALFKALRYWFVFLSLTTIFVIVSFGRFTGAVNQLIFYLFLTILVPLLMIRYVSRTSESVADAKASVLLSNTSSLIETLEKMQVFASRGQVSELQRRKRALLKGEYFIGGNRSYSATLRTSLHVGFGSCYLLIPLAPILFNPEYLIKGFFAITDLNIPGVNILAPLFLIGFFNSLIFWNRWWILHLVMASFFSSIAYAVFLIVYNSMTFGSILFIFFFIVFPITIFTAFPITLVIAFVLASLLRLLLSTYLQPS